MIVVAEDIARSTSSRLRDWQRAGRFRSQLLARPARTIEAAMDRLFAVQSQDFWGGRLALSLRTAAAPNLAAVDREFERGTLVRTWTMRGTLHTLLARDVHWLLSVTADRQLWQQKARLAEHSVTDAEIDRAADAARDALSGTRLARAELIAALEARGIDCTGPRGNILLNTISLRAVIVQGPVVTRAAPPTREQYFVLADEHITARSEVADPLAEMFTRYAIGHGPVTVADFAWWSGLPKSLAAEAAARCDDRLRITDVEGVRLYLAAKRAAPPRKDAPSVRALPSFDEYFIGYRDRMHACSPTDAKQIGPLINGLVRPTLLHGEHIVGVWRHSRAAGQLSRPPVAEFFDREHAPLETETEAALAAYLDFLSGRARQD